MSITGITGAGSATSSDIRAQLDRIRAQSDLPIAVGFGITTPEKAADIASVADAVVVGSAVVKIIADNLDDDGKAQPGLADKVLSFVGELANGVRGVAK